jgi:putative ABC transport system permease protein
VLSFDLAGDKLKARIGSVHDFNPRSHQFSATLLLNPRAIGDLPRSWAASLHLAPDRDAALNRTAQDFPNITVFDLAPVLLQWQKMTDQLVRAAQFLFLFTLASGILVLYAALAGSQDVRVREAALLRSLGATGRQLARAQWIEYGLLGSLAGLLAATGASGASWLLAHFVFHLDWHCSLLLWPVGAVAGVLCALAGSWAGLRRILRQAPLTSLRAA